MSTQRQQKFGVGALAAIAFVVAMVVIVLTGAAAASPSGSRSEHSPAGGFRSDQSWFLFNGDGATCHVEMWSVNNNRSLHDNFLITVDTNGTTTHMEVERFQGTTDRGLWDSTETGEVYLQLTLGDDQRSSASYHTEWSCEEVPPSTTTSSPPESTVPSTSVPDTTVTSVPEETTTSSSIPTTTLQICAVSDCNVTDPPTTTTSTSVPSPTTTTTTSSSTVPPSTPTGVPTGEG